MARIRYKYVNLNPFVVIVPDKRGSTASFNTNQYSSDEWYGRFVGPKQLSRVPIVAGDIVAEQASVNIAVDGKTVVVPQPEPQVKIVLEEQTNDYVKKNGMYYCKYCTEFRSSKKSALLFHLSEYHQLGGVPETPKTAPQPAAPKAAPQTDTPKLIIPKKTPAPASPDLPKPPVSIREAPIVREDAVLEAAEDTEGSPVVVGTGVWECPHDGRRFKTERGLKIHMTKSHGVEA